MKRIGIVIGICVLLVVSGLAQETNGGRGRVCADGYALNLDEAEQQAVQLAQEICVSQGGTPQGTLLEYSGCGFFSCRATACTKCLIPGLPAPRKD